MKPHTNTTYNRKDILRYLSGNISYEEMHALEIAALSDPLLHDAIEGYATEKTEDTDLAFIREKIQTKKSDNPISISGFPLYKLFAVAATLLLIFFSAYFLLNRQQQQQLAVTVSPPNATKSAAVQKPVQIENTGSNDESVNIKPQNPLLNKVANQMEAISKKPMMADLKIQSESDQNKQFGLDADGLADKMKLESEESNVIVTDSISVTTDSRLNGTYAVNERKDKETTAAEVSAPITAYSSPPQLDEVVVTSARVKNAVKVGNGATQAISAASISKKENTDDFLNYINNNKRECRDSTGNSVHGKVVLSYRLDKAGKPINIIVEKGLNANCDEEAIKLLKDAPPAINRKPSKRNITISF